MVRRNVLFWSPVLLCALLGGCQLILPFDENKLDSSSAGPAGGGQGPGGSSSTQPQGGSAGTMPTSGTAGNSACMDPAKDCDAPSGECKVFACDAGTCVEGDIQEGGPAAIQTAGDCKQNVCKGGTVTPEDDAADPLNDMNECTTDSCQGGTPKSDPAMKGAACTMGGTVCDGAGLCVECNESVDCKDALKPACSGNKCIPATCNDNETNGDETDTDCGGSCTPCADTLVCKVAGDCQSGVCKNEGGTLKCQVPTCTDNVKNGVEGDKDCGAVCPTKCGPMKGCNGNGDCVGNECTAAMNGVCTPNCQDEIKNNAETDVDCGAGTCGPCMIGKDCGTSDANCDATAFCSMMGKCTADKPNGQSCKSANQCLSDNCIDTVCCNNVCGAKCFSCNLPGAPGNCTAVPSGQDPDLECPGATNCSAGACTKLANGTACTAAGECMSGNCIDGRCCNNACSGTCQSCNLAGTVGTCSLIPSGQDPEMECPGNGGSDVCDGSGSCGKVNGSTCMMADECVSNQCIDGVCCDGACNGICRACSAAKTGGANGICSNIIMGSDPDMECTGNLVCAAGACSAPYTLGTACTIAGECASNFCTDGVCCNAACGGACRGCNAAGMCTLYAAGTDPENECNAPTPNCNSSGTCIP